MSIMENGIQKYADQIEKNIHQARYLAQKIEANTSLELMAPVPLNIVCFRFVKDGVSDHDLDIINKEIVMTLQESGIASPSSTILNGKYAIRVAITNHRSIQEDFDLLVDAVLKIGKEKSVNSIFQ